MASSTTFVIVGGGLAGLKPRRAPERLWRSIILFGDEEVTCPYDRPPLHGVSAGVAERLSPSRPPIGTATMTVCGQGWLHLCSSSLWDRSHGAHHLDPRRRPLPAQLQRRRGIELRSAQGSSAVVGAG